jgi:hypothetical protein
MPVQRCRRDGKPGYRWGDEGKCYIYTPGNESSRKQAKQKAAEQGRAIKARETQNFVLSGSLQHMASEDILGFVETAALNRIRAKDPNPYIAAFTIAHEGTAKPKKVGGGTMLLKYFKDAIKSIHDNLKIGTKVFLGHDENNDNTRPSVGEVVGKTMRTIGGKLHDVAAIYLSPDFVDREKMDVASIEAEIEFVTGEDGLEAVGTRGVHGIALGDSSVEKPAFDGAKLLAAIAAFSEERTVDTKDEVLSRIAESGWTPSDLFPEDELFKDEVISRKVSQTGYEAARRVRNEELAPVQNELTQVKEQLTSAQREALAGRTGSILDSVLEELGVQDDKMKRFIQRRAKKHQPKAEDENGLREEIKSLVEDTKDEFEEMQDLFGIESKSGESDSDSNSGSESDSGSGSEEEDTSSQNQDGQSTGEKDKSPSPDSPSGDYVSGAGTGYESPETNEFIPT